jgi:hypothetical protein
MPRNASGENGQKSHQRKNHRVAAVPPQAAVETNRALSLFHTLVTRPSLVVQGGTGRKIAQRGPQALKKQAGLPARLQHFYIGLSATSS